MTMNRENEQLLQAGISAVRADDRKEGARLLAQVVRKEPQSEEAWFWLAAATDQPAEAAACLRRVLTINPNNTRAQQALTMLESGQGASAFSAAMSGNAPAPMPSAPAMPDPYSAPMRPLNTGELLTPATGLDRPPGPSAGTPPPPPFGGGPAAPPPPPFGGAPNWANDPAGATIPASSTSLSDPYGGTTVGASPMQSAPPPPPFTGGGGVRLGQLDPNAPVQAPPPPAAPPIYDPGAELRASLLSEQAQAPVAPPPPTANAKDNKKGKDKAKDNAKDNKNAQQQKGAAVKQRKGAAAVADPNDPKAKKKRKFNPLLLALAVLVLFAAVAGVLFLLRGQNQGGGTTTDPSAVAGVDTTATALAANAISGTTGAAATGGATTPGAAATGGVAATGVAGTGAAATGGAANPGGPTPTSQPRTIAPVGTTAAAGSGTPGAGQTAASGTGNNTTASGTGNNTPAGSSTPGAGQTAASGTGNTTPASGTGNTAAAGGSPSSNQPTGAAATGAAATAGGIGGNLTPGTLPPRTSVTPRPTVAGTVGNPSGNSNATPGLTATSQAAQLPTVAGGSTGGTTTTRPAGEVPTATPTGGPLPTLSGGTNSNTGATPPNEVSQYLEQTRTYLSYSKYFEIAIGVGVIQPYRSGRIKPGVTRINTNQLYRGCNAEILIPEQAIAADTGILPPGNNPIVVFNVNRFCVEFGLSSTGSGEAANVTGTPVVTAVPPTPTPASSEGGNTTSNGTPAAPTNTASSQTTPAPTARGTQTTASSGSAVPVALQRVWIDTPYGPRLFYRFLVTGQADIGQTTLSLGRMARIIKDQTVPNDAYELHQVALEYATDISQIADNIDRFFFTGDLRYLEQASILYDKAQRDQQRWIQITSKGYPFKVDI